ncbi:YrpD family protein [Paenibacillus macerans]|uniref:YrpD family protein n=1 Tax=Paenibacillus macerans TaxID=44252 RepID=UPI003D318427
MTGLLLTTVLLMSVSSVSASPPTYQDTTDTRKEIQISNLSSSFLPDDQLQNMIEHAKEVLNEVKSENTLSLQSIDRSYQYIYLPTDPSEISYVYEEPLGGAPQLTLLDSNIGTDSYTPNSLPTDQTDFISDGVGGRIYITPSGSSSSYLSTSLKLPADSEVIPNTAAYNYIGFTASNVESDFGTVYVTTAGPNSTEKGWRVAVTLKINGSKVTMNPVSPYNQMWNKNAYLSNSTVVLYTWYNYSGKARLKVDGTATCADNACTNSANTSLTSVFESGVIGSSGLSSISNWKLLSTVVSSNNTGKNKAIFSNIKINGTAVPSSSFGTPQQDHAYITRDSSNTVTIDVDSSKYPL